MKITPFIQNLPKAELHLHIEGTFEPELMFAIAARNGIALPHRSVEELRQAYRFSNLEDFLDVYYQGMNVLKTERDFHDLTYAYLERVAAQSVRHVEIFFDPQAHTARGVPFDVVIDGIWRALERGEAEFGISFRVIMCILRHLGEDDAFITLEQALDHRERIVAVGLDSSEQGHPPSKFANVFRKARAEGFLAVAHAGEEGPPEYVAEALDVLGVARIDHGNRALEDDALVARLASLGMPLTVCPLSNHRLRVVRALSEHPLPRMLDAGLVVTLNSDDPAFFGGYINENYQAMRDHAGITDRQLALIARNSFTAAFLDDQRRNLLLAELDAYLDGEH